VKSSTHDLFADGPDVAGLSGKGIGLEHDLPNLRMELQVELHFVDHFNRIAQAHVISVHQLGITAKGAGIVTAPARHQREKRIFLPGVRIPLRLNQLPGREREGIDVQRFPVGIMGDGAVVDPAQALDPRQLLSVGQVAGSEIVFPAQDIVHNTLSDLKGIIRFGRDMLSDQSDRTSGFVFDGPGLIDVIVNGWGGGMDQEELRVLGADQIKGLLRSQVAGRRFDKTYRMTRVDQNLSGSQEIFRVALDSAA